MKKGFSTDFQVDINVWILLPTIVLSKDHKSYGVAFAWLCIITIIEYKV